MASADLQMQIDSGGGFGAPVAGGQTLATGDIVRLSAPDYTGWRSGRYEFPAGRYPDGWTCPAGWTDDGDGTYYYLASNISGFSAPDITFPAAGGIWGTWLPRLIVNDTIIDETVGIRILSPGGLHETAKHEREQYGGETRKAAGPQQENLRLIEFILGGSGSLAVSGVKRPVRVATTANLVATRVANTLTANANASINTAGIDGVTDLAVGQDILLNDQSTGADRGIYTITDLGSAGTPYVLERRDDFDTSAKAVAGSEVYVQEGTANQKTKWQLVTTGVVLNTTTLVFTQLPATADKTLLDAATSSATALTLVRRGSGGEAAFGYLTVGALPSDAGALRVANATILAAARNKDNNGNLTCIETDASNNVYFGQSSAEGGNTYFRTPLASTMLFYNDASPMAVLDVAQLDLRVPRLTWGPAVASPVIRQADDTANGATGDKLTVGGQNATGTGATGGDAEFGSGTGTAAHGALALKVGSSTVLSIASGAVPATAGTLRLPDSATIQVAGNTGDVKIAEHDSGTDGLIYGDGSDTLAVRTSDAFSLEVNASTVFQALYNVNHKIGFFGATPIARPSAYTQTYATTSRTVNAYTADDESAAYSGIDNAQPGSVYAQLTDLNALRAAVENLRARVENNTDVLGQVIDDQQAYGLFQ